MAKDHNCADHIVNGVCVICLGTKMAEQGGVIGANQIMNNQVPQNTQPNIPQNPGGIDNNGIMHPTPPPSVSQPNVAPQAPQVNKDGGAMTNMSIMRKVGDGEIGKNVGRTNPAAIKKCVAYMNKMKEGEYMGTSFYAHSDDAMFNTRVPRGEEGKGKNIKPIGHSNDDKK